MEGKNPIIQRLEKIAVMEGLTVEQFDIDGTKRFLDENSRFNPRCEISLHYSSEHKLLAVSLGISYESDEEIPGRTVTVSDGHDVFYAE